MYIECMCLVTSAEDFLVMPSQKFRINSHMVHCTQDVWQSFCLLQMHLLASFRRLPLVPSLPSLSLPLSLSLSLSVRLSVCLSLTHTHPHILYSPDTGVMVLMPLPNHFPCG